LGHDVFVDHECFAQTPHRAGLKWKSAVHRA
jgi:hypothetical protein